MENTRCRAFIREFVARWLPLLIYAAFLFYVSSLHQPRVATFRHSDKVYHALLYAGFGLLLVRAFSARTSGWSRGRVLEVAALGAVAYGLTDEFHQIFVKGRSPEFADVVADGIGGLFGGSVYLIILYAQRRRGQGKVPDGPQAMASDRSR